MMPQFFCLGKLYYFNSETKKSSWTHPLAKNTIPQLRASEIAEMTPEDQFFYLLRKSGISSEYSWESALRLIINDPIYSSALKTVSERKEAFAKYLVLQKEREKALAEKAEQEKRSAFRKLLEKTPKIHLATRWRSVMPLFSNDPAFLAISSEREREMIFEEVIDKLREEKRNLDMEQQKKIRGKLRSLLGKVSWSFHSPSASWDTIIPQLEQQTEWSSEEPDFDAISRLDLLLAYEGIVLEDQEAFYLEARKKNEQERTDAIRRRISFSLHLESLVHKGLISSSSQWIENAYPILKDSPSFKELLEKNTNGSCPLDLFYDTIDRLEAEQSAFSSKVTRYLQEYPHDVLADPKALADIYAHAEKFSQRSEVLSGLSPISPRNRAIKSFVQSLFRHLENLFFSCREFKNSIPLREGEFSLRPFALSSRIPSTMLEKNYRTGLRRLVYFTCIDALLAQKREEKKRSHAAKRVLYDEFKAYLKANRSFVLAHDTWPAFRDQVWIPSLEKEFGTLGEHLACRAFGRFKEKAAMVETCKHPRLGEDADEDSTTMVANQPPVTSRPVVFKTFSRATTPANIPSSASSSSSSSSGRPRTISSYSDIA